MCFEKQVLIKTVNDNNVRRNKKGLSLEEDADKVQSSQGHMQRHFYSKNKSDFELPFR